MTMFTGEMIEETDSEDDGEDGDDEDDVQEFMNKEKQKLEEEKQAILNNKSLITEVRGANNILCR